MSDFCVLCACEDCLCSLIWWNWVSFDVYVHWEWWFCDLWWRKWVNFVAYELERWCFLRLMLLKLSETWVLCVCEICFVFCNGKDWVNFVVCRSEFVAFVIYGDEIKWFMVFGYLSLDLMCLWLSDFCGLYAWDGCLCSLIWRKMSDFCVLCSWEMVFLRFGLVKLSDFCWLCAWEGCLCSLFWWNWVSFDVYVHENDDSVICDDENGWILCTVCLRRLFV